MVSDNVFYNAYYQPGENPVFCYRSGLAVYEEQLFGGMLCAAGWNAAGYPLNVLSGFPSRLDYNEFTEPSAFNIDIDGCSIDRSLEFIDFSVIKNENHDETVLVLDSKLKPVRLYVHTVLDGTQMFSRYIEIENLSDSPLSLSRLSLLSGGVEKTDFDRYPEVNDVNKIYSVGYFGSDRWGREGEFGWHDLHPEGFSVSTRFGADRFRHPLVFVRNNCTGLIYFCQIGWSSGCRFTIDLDAHPERRWSKLVFKAEVTSHNPMAIISPKEKFTTPEVHMGVVIGSLDDAVNEMHAHVRKSVLNNAAADPSACLVGAGMGAEHDMSVETSKAFADQFAQMGAEVFIVDAGWECPPDKQTDWGNYNGIRIPNPERYPNGLKELSDYCHSIGLKFGLWVDIESLGCLSDDYKNHPEWRATDIFGNRNPRMADMSDPAVAEHFENELARIITEYNLDLLRVDHNVSYREYFAFNEKGECISIRHHQAVYEMYNRLKARFPEVIFENCAGGGARTDLGMMKNFNHTWVSDCQRAPYSVSITNGMTMALPPERVDRLFAGMGCHEHGSIDLQMRNTMLGHMSLNVIAPVGAEINSVQMDFVRRSVKIYKEFIRPILPVSKVYHHTPEAFKEGFCAIEIAMPDCSKGAAGIFATKASAKEFCKIFLKGISAGKKYKITLDNSGARFALSGYELINNGLSISIPCALSSELVIYEEITE